MSPWRWIGILLVIVCIMIGCGWYFAEPQCPDVAGYREQHPGVQCR